MARSASPACLLSLSLLAFPVAAAAQDPPSASATTRLIPYSAVFPAAAADATAGARTVTFALYDEAENGTLLWSEVQTIAADARRRFSTHLGSVTPLPLEIFRTEQARWLEVSVDGHGLPRTMLVAVPYALRAADAETFGGKPLSDFVLSDENGRRVRADGTAIDDPAVDGTGVPNQIAKWSTPTTLSSSIITESFDNRIGILAPDPTGGGIVDSRFTIRHVDNNTAIGVLNTLNQRRFALNTNANGSWTLFDGGSGGGAWSPGLTQWNGRIAMGVMPFVAIADFRASFGTAVLGVSSGGTGVEGDSQSSHGVRGFSTTGVGISGMSQGSGLAGQFSGNVTVSGLLTKGGGAFQIDHPLDPENRYLQHSFVESPDMMNVYNGNVSLDANGEAWVTLPDWFEALNRDFRYQLTSIGGPATPYIATEITGNRFRIAGGAAHGKVSWQVTGIRHDAWANAHRIIVEPDKKADERGLYLHPDAFDLPPARALPSLRVLPTRLLGQERR